MTKKPLYIGHSIHWIQPRWVVGVSPYKFKAMQHKTSRFFRLQFSFYHNLYHFVSSSGTAYCEHGYQKHKPVNFKLCEVNHFIRTMQTNTESKYIHNTKVYVCVCVYGCVCRRFVRKWMSVNVLFSNWIELNLLKIKS